MDITAFIASLDYFPFTQLSLLFHDYAYSLVAILSLITIPYFRKRGKYYALAISMVTVIALALLLKELYTVPRPCQVGLPWAKVCPPIGDNGFPSGHTAFAFVFVAASIGTHLLPVYLFLGLLVGFSRIYLGVHSLGDVAGGALLGMLTYLAAEEAVDWWGRKKVK